MKEARIESVTGYYKGGELMLLTGNRTFKLAVETMGSSLENFLSKDTIMEFTTLELLHQAVTCTFPASRLLPAYTRKRRGQLYEKCALLETGLTEKEEYLGKSSSISFLDSTEKSAISYYLGMIFTKLIAERLFDITYLVHLHLIQGEDGMPLFYANGKRRTEMAGWSRQTQAYSLWVSKGRSNNSVEALREGALQAGELAAVNDMPPQWAAVCMSFYEKGFLTAKLQGAQKIQEDKEKAQIHFSREEFLKAYYTPVRQLFLEFYNREEMEDTRYLGMDFVECRVQLPYFLEDQDKNAAGRSFLLGMPRTLIEEGLEGLPAQEKWQELSEYFQEKWGEDCYLGQDFVYVRHTAR